MSQSKPVYILAFFYLLTAIVLPGSALAENTDSTALVTLYHTFETTARAGDGTGHGRLYVSKHAPVHIIKETDGPVICCAKNLSQWLNVISNNPGNGLSISNQEYEIRGNLASSIANYSGFGAGMDVFGYLKTIDGWRLLALQCSGRPIAGGYALSNTIDEVLASLNTTITAENVSGFLDLFASKSTPFFAFHGEFNEPYAVDKHTVEGFTQSIGVSDTSIALQITETDIRVEDAYLARIWVKYAMIRNQRDTESGTALILMFATKQSGWRIGAFAGFESITNSARVNDLLPDLFYLEQNHPNPFNPSTRIEYSIRQNARIHLRLLNVLGQPIRTLVDEKQSEGRYSVLWDGHDDRGMQVSAGTYLVQLSSGSQSVARRITLLQ